MTGADKQRWYPNVPADTPGWMREAFRQICDRVYEGRDDMGPASVTSKGTGSVVIGTSATTIPGTQLNLPRSGNWIIIGQFRITVETGDDTKAISGLLQIGGTAHQTQGRLVAPTAGLTLTLVNVWRITANKKQTISLAVSKASDASGASVVDGQQSSITALWGGG